MMRRFAVITTLFAVMTLCSTDLTFAQTQPAQPAPPADGRPMFATSKVEGTDNVYIFRYQNHQSMFVVTNAGVIATDPIGLRRPQAVTTYVDEIKKVTNQPIKYVIYSHSHYDHIAGGKLFKDLGATFIAHKNAKAQLEKFPSPDVVMPDEVVDNERTLNLGGTTLELLYVGRNHSDNSLVMRLPKEKLIFTVDFIPIQNSAVPQLARHRVATGVGGVAAARCRHGVGAHDTGTPLRRRPARHQARRDGPHRLHAGPCGGSEEGGGRGKVHRYRHERSKAAEVREMGQLCELPAAQRRALLLPQQRLLKRVLRGDVCLLLAQTYRLDWSRLFVR